MNKADLITPKGYRLLQEEENFLWRIERPEITAKVAWAASLGDRSDNADYQTNKAKLRKIHSRVRFLRKRLAILQVIDYAKSQEGKIYFGAWVTIEDEDENTKTFQIIGSDEVYKHAAPCSINSPLARALVGKQVGDEVKVTSPNGTMHYGILDITYRQER